MADADARTETETVEDEYTWWEVVYWLIGIVAIPLVPIIMVTCFAPYSGVGGR